MTRRGWVIAVAVAFGVAGMSALGAFAYYGRARLLALVPPRIARLTGLGPSGVPAAPRALALPIPDAASSLPFIGEEGTYPDGYPKKTASVVGMRALLRHRRFDDLTRYVEELEREAVADPRKEYWAWDSVRAFDSADPTLGPLLEEWVARAPRSFAPFAARAAYRSALGAHARGTAYAAKTSAAQFAEQKRLLDLADADIARALSLNPAAFSPRVHRVANSRHRGSERAVFDEAVKRFPESYLIRYFYMTGETPRWGGSYAVMSAVARDAQALATKNPRLSLLPGVVLLAVAEDHLPGDPKGALPAAERAFTYGENWNFYELRGRVREHLGDTTGARADFEKGLALRPEHADLLADKAHVLWGLRRFEEAADAYLEALEVDPSEHLENLGTFAGAFEYAGRKHVHDGRPVEALRAFDKALLLDPGHAGAKAGRAALLSHGDPGANETEVTAAVDRALREDTFEAYLAVDDVLAKRGRFAEVIGHWDRYLASHAADGRAFMERGGAYTHLHRAAEAERDADSACKLGVERGCALRGQMQAIEKRWNEEAKKAASARHAP